MSSRRKSSNPCVLRATSFTAEDSVETDVLAKTVLGRYSPVPLTADENCTSLNDKEEEQSEGGSASEQNFRYHKSEGPVSTLYLCTICNFSTNKSDSLSCHNKVQHPGESRFKVRHIKLDSQSILEQTIESENEGYLPDIIYDSGLFVDSSNQEDEETGKTPMENSSILEKGLDVEKELDSPVLKDEIRAVRVNGTIIIPEPTSHVTPLLQRPPNLSTSPTIAVPIHTTKYNPILDSNVSLITSFSQFPYPTHAELSWLTAASRHPEDQIKVWFTTQRLKQGITWSPEEVEEARKKMFNGSIAPAHQICKIWPAPFGEPLNPCQATCHGFGQTSLASNITTDRSPTTCTPGIATAVRQAQTLKRTLGTPLLASEVKRPTGDPKESLCMPPPPAPPPDRLAIASSPGLSETRTSMSTNLKRSVIDQQMSNHTSTSSFVAKNKFGNGVTMPLAPARVKDKSPGQMKLLEESFQRNSFPSYNEVEQLVITTRMAREEIESWFLERRALRDDLEQALLNSMGSKRESQQTLLNGAQRRSGNLSFSPVPQVSKSANLLKNVFVQNRWPSPIEFRHLEMQARLARTELVRWFRDSRLPQQGRVLDRKEMFGEQNIATKRPLREENTKPSSPEIENWFGNTGSNGEKSYRFGTTCNEYTRVTAKYHARVLPVTVHGQDRLKDHSVTLHTLGEQVILYNASVLLGYILETVFKLW
uniref:Zinc fingers and homeoboxes protein 2-like n=1 Tax=Sinocyclocheilus anshuiensis TaxID=1608454 RepID=A0A671M7N2_9TELE